MWCDDRGVLIWGMRNFSRSISFFLFENEWKRENFHKSDLAKRETKSLLDSKKQKKKAKILFKEQVSLFRSKIQKNSKRILQNRENNEKIIRRRRRSPLGRNSTHHFVVLIYIHQSSLKIKCSRLREEGLPLRNEEDNEDIEAFSEVVLSPLKKKQTTF